MSTVQSFVVVLFASLLLVACGVEGGDSPAEGIVFENVTVVPLDEERTLSDQTVVIEGETIADVGDAGEVDVPEGAQRVDASGRYLMPGLAEMHAHLPTANQPEERRNAVLTLFVTQGVTFARGMAGGPSHPVLRDSIEEGHLLGPTLRVAGPFMSGDMFESPEAARDSVEAYKEQGYDLLKIGEGLSPEVYDAIVEEAQEQDIPFAGHVSDEVGLMRSLEAGQRTVDHLDNYVEALRTSEAPEDFPAIFGPPELVPYLDRSQLSDIVDATAEAGTAVAPTMELWETFFDDRPAEAYREEQSELRYLPSSMVDNWAEGVSNMREQVDPEQGQEVIELRREILSALHEEGVPVLLGSDAPQSFNVPGFSVHEEMQYMQNEVGMSPYEVLVSGTRAVAEFYDAEDAFGTVESGQRADLILTRENPLEDVANASEIDGVVVRGQWLSADDIEERLDEIESGFRQEG